MSVDINALHDNRSDPETRMVLEDWERSRYRTSSVSRLGLALSILAADAADAASEAADDDADDAASEAAAAADDADVGADDGAPISNYLTEPDMKEGLKILVLPGGYYGRGVFRVGWLKRISGDEYELHGARTIRRTGAYQAGGFDILAEKGPGSGYALSEAAEDPEDINRLLIKRSKSARESVWKDHCPKPKWWGK